ncbi:DHA2 family efflux MFS transporter permease subunit [Brevibacillus sp. B_LB10_24]|uniref:DHA2 family efflux MFS transporter permease subunit n=1 Tax=Brevibacillus sp. B_LB10_24 TaxID=3380645 RepID=UPI0038BDA43D
MTRELESDASGSGSSKWLSLLAIVLGTFAAVLNSSLLNVALPKITTVLNSTTDVTQWILTGYMLASAVAIPFSGFLGDKFGYKTIFTISLAGFTVGSLLCGIAWSDITLIFFRIVQGIGGGLIMPLGMTIIYSVFPRSQMGTALGIWGIAAMTAPAIGPTLSGLMVEHLGWRSLFFLMVPVGGLAAFMGMVLLKETEKKAGQSLDKWGAILSITCFGTLLLALSKGQSEGWTSFYIVSLLFVAAFSLILLIWVELGHKDPILDLRIFANLRFTISSISSSLITMGMIGGTYLIPIYLQSIQGLSAIQTGLLLLPQSVAMALMMPISGKLFDKFGVVPIGLVGLSITAVTTFALGNLAVDTPNSWLNMVLTIRGIGIGLCMQPLGTVGMNAVPPHQVGRASPLSNVTRQVFSSMAIAIFTMLMSQFSTYYSAKISENISITNDTANQVMQQLSALYSSQGLDAASSQAMAASALGGMIAKEATVRAIGETFMVSAIPVFLCIPLTLFFIQRRERKKTQPERVASKDKRSQEELTPELA